SPMRPSAVSATGSIAAIASPPPSSKRSARRTCPSGPPTTSHRTTEIPASGDPATPCYHRASVVERVTEVTEAVSVPTQFFPGAILINRFRVEQELGKGGSGVVIRAYDLAQSRQGAIKVLHVDVDQATEQRFRAEAEATRQLRSEHVIRVLETGTLEDGSPFMAMELLEGVDLGTRLVREGRIPVQQAIAYVLQACE